MAPITFDLTFAVIVLVLARLITASVVAAAVVASYQPIGMLKSTGSTPGRSRRRAHRQVP